MGNSHYKSNLRAKTGAEVITGFNRIATIAKIVATDLYANTLASVPTIHGTTKVIAGTYIQIGSSGRYILTSTSNAATTIAKQAYTTLGTPYKGSLTFGSDGIWRHKNNFANTNASAEKLDTV